MAVKQNEHYRFWTWRGLLELVCMLGDEASVHIALLEVLKVQDHGVVLDSGRHTRDDQLVQSAAHAVDGRWPVLRPHNQLTQQRVIVGRYLQI